MYDEISTSLAGMCARVDPLGPSRMEVPAISFSLTNFPCCEEVYCFGTTSSTKDPMRVRILTERVMFLRLHPLKHIVMSKSSSHVTGFYRLTQPAVGSRGRHLYIAKMYFTEHESVALEARGAVLLAARSRYHGMVSLEKMRIIPCAVRW